MPAGCKNNRCPARACHVFKPHRYAKALNQGNEHGEVTGVLRDLASTRLPFFLGHALDVGADHLQKLDDNACRNVRHDAQSEHRDVRQAAAGKHVKQAEKRTRHALKKRRQRRSVNARNGHMNAYAVAAQNQEGPADALGQRSLARHIVCRSYCHETLVAFVRLWRSMCATSLPAARRAMTPVKAVRPRLRAATRLFSGRNRFQLSDVATGVADLFRSSLAELVSFHRQSACNITARKNFHG